MTTIAARQFDGEWNIACDSQETRDGGESSSIKLSCEKLFRVTTTRFTGGKEAETVIVATAGESSPGMAFIHWLQTDDEPFPEWLREREIAMLVLAPSGLFEFDGCGIGQKRTEEFYAVGSGAPYALGAMELGANPYRAVQVAMKFCPYTGGTIHIEWL
jgi:hypothetical protein